jgi:hypothetical protein
LDETATNPETRVQPCSFASGAVLSAFSCWYVNAQIGLGSAIAAAAAAAAQARADAQRKGNSAPQGDSGWREFCARVNTALDSFYSKFGPVTFDSDSELKLLNQYFRGDHTPYALSAAEMDQARAYVYTFGSSVLGPVIRVRSDGLVERIVHFGFYASSAPLLDGLLGSATGVFSKTGLVGLRDNFNFDFKSRGGYPKGTLANVGVAEIRSDAALCGGGGSIPMTGGQQ